MLLPVVLGHNLDILGWRRYREGSSIWMPRNLGATLRFGVQGSDNAIDSPDQLRLVRRQGIDINDSINTGQGYGRAYWIEGEMLRRLVVFIEMADLCVVLRFHQLDSEVVAGNCAPLRIRRKGDIADGKRTSDEKLVECGIRNRVQTDSPVF